MAAASPSPLEKTYPVEEKFNLWMSVAAPVKEEEAEKLITEIFEILVKRLTTTQAIWKSQKNGMPYLSKT